MVEAEVKKTSGEESLQPALDKDAEAADLDRGCASIPLQWASTRLRLLRARSRPRHFQPAPTTELGPRLLSSATPSCDTTDAMPIPGMPHHLLSCAPAHHRHRTCRVR